MHCHIGVLQRDRAGDIPSSASSLRQAVNLPCRYITITNEKLGGGVHIISNDQGRRITPSWVQVSFTVEERL